MTDAPADRLRRRVTDRLKPRFVGRDEVIDLIALAAVAGEHLFLYGPPGTAKSLIVREFAAAVRCQYFVQRQDARVEHPCEVVRRLPGVRA